MRLSENFRSRELACACCWKFIQNDELIAVLEQIRFAVDRPIFISSGTRCRDHNFLSGGVVDSWHLLGNAVDIPTYSKRDKFEVAAAAIAA